VLVSEQHYVAKENDKRIIFFLCIGLKNANGGPLIDNEKDPWAKQPADVKKPKLANHLMP
jgi:hypothetical protein